MNQQIMVSVLMLSYNQKKYVCQAVDSVLNQQTDFLYEILIGDDASTDGTRECLYSKYSENDQIKLYLRTKNIGGTKNVYHLCMRAKGKYLCVCECDDYWTDIHYLQTMVAWMENHNTYAGVAARRVFLSEKTKRQELKRPLKECNCDISLDDFMLYGKKFDMCACLFRNFFHDQKSDYRIYRASRNVGDLTVAIHILNHGNIYQLENIMGVYRTDRIKGSANYNSIWDKKEIFLEHIHILNYLSHKCYSLLDYSVLQSRYANDYLKTKSKGMECIKGYLFAARHISRKAFIKLMIYRIRN